MIITDVDKSIFDTQVEAMFPRCYIKLHLNEFALVRAGVISYCISRGLPRLIEY